MWSSPSDLKNQLARLWEQGALLREALAADSRFPLRLSFKGPTPADVTDRFDAVRTWVATLAATPPLRLEWQSVRHRVHGTQDLPSRIFVDSLEEALHWLGKTRAWERFSMQVAMTRAHCPALLPWLEKRPVRALEHADHWPAILAVVQWVQAHPRPGLYLRQVDVPGVHSKFIEAHRGILSECLDLALPASQIDTTKTGVTQFAARYGFSEKPMRVRFRVLDPSIVLMEGLCTADITLDTESLRRVDMPAYGVRRIVITENEINFLCLPPLTGAIALFGAGYGWEALSGADWIKRCALHYWGDIDTHGFAILDRLRAHYPHAQSVLMDRETLLAHAPFWGHEDTPHRGELPRLTAKENALYTDLRDERLGKALRLEQEHLGFSWVAKALHALPDPHPQPVS